MADKLYFKKIKMPSGQVYWLKDDEAAHLDENGDLVLDGNIECNELDAESAQINDNLNVGGAVYADGGLHTTSWETTGDEDGATTEVTGSYSVTITQDGSTYSINFPGASGTIATEEYVSSKVTNVLVFKGTVATETALKAITGAKKGWFYLVSADSSEWVATADAASESSTTTWEKFGTAGVQGALYKGTTWVAPNNIVVSEASDGKTKTVGSLSVSTTGSATGNVSVSGTGHKLGTIEKHGITASASRTAVGADGTQVVNTGYDVSSSRLEVQAGILISGVHETDIGNADVGSPINVGTSLTGTKTFATSGLASAALAEDTATTPSFSFNTDAIKSASCSQSFAVAGVTVAIDGTDTEQLNFTNATTNQVNISTSAATKKVLKYQQLLQALVQLA